jgi:hypothetical protein
MLTMLCVATYIKGEDFLRECRRLGAAVFLLTANTLANASWPHDAIAEIHTIPRDAPDAEIRRVVSGVARRHRIDRIVALDDFDVETGAMLREFLQVPGFGRTVAARFRDKLTMRTEAARLGLTVPEFTSVVNDEEVNEWASRVAPPWMLKPRRSPAHTAIAGSSMGGLISLYAWLRWPDVFGLAAVMSPALWYGRSRLFEFVEAARVPRGRLYLDVGTDEGASTLNDSRALWALLKEKRVPNDSQLTYLEDRGGRHDEAAWARRFSGALAFLLEA